MRLPPSAAAFFVFLSALPSIAPAGVIEDLGAVAPGAVRVVLIRHGQAYSNLDPAPNLPPDQLDRLTTLGRTQSRQAGLTLRNAGVSLVISSPAGRAKESAEEIRSVLGSSEIRVEPRLRPLELGVAPSGQPLTWDQRRSEWKAGRDPAPRSGESLEDLGRRVADLISALRREHAGKTVALVAHSEVIGAYVGHVEGTPGAARYPPRAGNGSLTVVEAPAEGAPRTLLSNHVPAAASPAP